MTDESMPFLRRLTFAWGLFFQVLFNGRKALALAAPVKTPSLQPRITAGEHNSGAALLLGLFQQEGRFVDFLQQELTGFEDSEVGAVARSVHEGCRGVLARHMTVQPIRQESEGQSLTLESGFDANSVKLTGNVSGSAPYTGVLRHRGWRVSELKLPRVETESQALIVCQAEVEL